MSDSRSRILLVDDDTTILRAYGRVLRDGGWSVDPASDAREALERVKTVSFGTILTDVSMPNMGGLEFLRAVRELDRDVPVILMTGSPHLESAIPAIEHGAFRYLLKPVANAVLLETVRHAIRLHEMARLKREAFIIVQGERRRIGDQAGLAERFGMALDLLWMAYQPVISVKEHRVFGYEALLRCNEPSFHNPASLLDAAEQLGQLHDLSRAIRDKVAADAEQCSADIKLFVNLHALDLNDKALFAPDGPLSRIASRVVLEITECASLDGVKQAVLRVGDLRALGFQVAVDDLGAGHAGLSSYSQLEPDIAKIDMSLVRDIDTSPRKQAILRAMKLLFDELGTLVIAEGVETLAESNALVRLGFDLLQGYLFGRPQRGFCVPNWG
jgi:EAL domain-containing protein (putative c-di-GMP-specific phosphodiesterase class I)